MAVNRIFLGVDPTTNIAVSLETSGAGFFYVNISSTDLKTLFCRFVCDDEDLEQIANGKNLEMTCREGTCAIRPSGDEIVFEVHRFKGAQSSICALSANSFSRVVRLAKSRAYVG